MNRIEIRQLRNDDFSAIQLVGDSLAFLRDDYPHFEDWYRRLVIPELEDTRMVFLASPQDDRNRFAGALILKKTCEETYEEKKICTLYVHNDFRGQGIGTAFMDIARENLGCHPVITVSDRREVDFDSFLQRFDFERFLRYNEYYRPMSYEVSYNGPIEPVACKYLAAVIYRKPRRCAVPF